MLNRIFGDQNRKKLDDEVFGKMIYYPATSHEESYWFTNLRFGSQQKQIDCTIYNGEQGVSLEQKEFYLQIEKKYPDLESIIQTFINDQLIIKDWQRKNIVLEQDIDLYSLIIHRFDRFVDIHWGIDYREVRGFTTYEVEFKDWTPYWLSFSA